MKAPLARITHDKCVDFIRKHLSLKQGEGNIYSLEEILENIGDVFGGPNWLQKLENRDLFQYILERMDELMKPIEKIVLLDYYISGLSYNEISSKNNIPLGSVGVRLKRALEKLREEKENI